MKFIGSTSTDSFIPGKNLYFVIKAERDFCNLKLFGPLINNLIRYFFLILNIGALTGPKTLPINSLFRYNLNLIASLSNLFSFSPVKINEINLWNGGRLFFFLISISLSKKIFGFLFVISAINLWFELYVWKYTVEDCPVRPALPDNWWYNCKFFSAPLRSWPFDDKSISMTTIQFRFGKWNPLEINLK